MKTTFVSTSGVANATRRSVLEMQSELAKLQKEISSGRASDVGLALGSRTGQTVALRRDSASLQTLMDANAVAGLRLSTTQDTLGSIASDAQRFLGTLMQAKDDVRGASATAQQAGEKLTSFTGLLNTTQNGEYIFAGINSGAEPISDYSAPASPAKQAVANAFLAHFGFAQGDPAAASITSADMQDFIDNDLAPLFADPAWATNWSTASNQPVTNRISTAETVTTGVTANDSAMRKLAMAYTMVSDLGLSSLSEGAYGVVISSATDLVGEAIEGVTSTQARLGYSQQAVTDANTRMSKQKDVLEAHVGSLEGIDPYEASTRINSLLTQIETSYALTARIQKLSLLDFI
jgi:flagellar hook-associated protein 3 FlgL